MNLDRDIRCAYCKKVIKAGDDFYPVSFGTSSSGSLPMTTIISVHWDCTYKIVDRWALENTVKQRVQKNRRKR